MRWAFEISVAPCIRSVAYGYAVIRIANVGTDLIAICRSWVDEKHQEQCDDCSEEWNGMHFGLYRVREASVL